MRHVGVMKKIEKFFPPHSGEGQGGVRINRDKKFLSPSSGVRQERGPGGEEGNRNTSTRERPGGEEGNRIAS